MRLIKVGIWVVTAGLILSCGGETADTTGCIPNDTKECLCAGGDTGVQACNSTGDGYSPCQCGPPPVVFTQVDAGDRHTCGLKSNGDVECWGQDRGGVVSGTCVAEHTSDISKCVNQKSSGPFIQVDTSWNTNCAIKQTGTVTCWGWNGMGTCNAPPGSFSVISGSTHHFCGLRPNNVLECWGNTSDFTSTPVPPAGSYQSLSVGKGPFPDTCAITIEGSLVCFGKYAKDLAPPSGKFTQVAVGWAHACGLRLNGSIDCWGSTNKNVNKYGQATPPEGEFIAIAAGYKHSCAIRITGEVVCWGQGKQQIEPGYCYDSDGDCGQSAPPAGKFTHVTCGETHSCGVLQDGNVRCWGNDFDLGEDAEEGTPYYPRP